MADHEEIEYVTRMFHEAYERLAPEHGYETREASARPWEDVPAQNRGLMIAVVKLLVDRRIIDFGPGTYDAVGFGESNNA